MNLRQAAALALVGWYLLMWQGTTRCIADAILALNSETPEGTLTSIC